MAVTASTPSTRLRVSAFQPGWAIGASDQLVAKVTPEAHYHGASDGHKEKTRETSVAWSAATPLIALRPSRQAAADPHARSSLRRRWRAGERVYGRGPARPLRAP